MEQVGKPSGLVRRKSTWYFRIRVPKDVARSFDFAEKWVSLRTGDYGEALRRLSEVSSTWQAAFAAKRALETPTGPAPLDHLRLPSNEEALRLAQHFFAVKKGELEGTAGSFADFETDEAMDAQAELAADWQELRLTDHPDTARKVDNIVQQLLPSDCRATSALYEYVRRALEELSALELARFSGDRDRGVRDELFRGFSNAEPTPSAVVSSPAAAASDPGNANIASLADRFQREVLLVGNVAESTRKTRAVALDFVIRHFGPSTDVRTLKRRDAVGFRDILANVPSNATKRFGPNNSPRDLASFNKHDQFACMAHATQKTYLQMAAKFFEWVQDEGYLASNIARNLQPDAEFVPYEDRRYSYTIEQLNRIFSSPVYRGCVDDKRQFAVPGPNVIRKSRYWLPLLALFTGMRPGELLQLTPRHLHVTPSGTHFIFLTRDMQLKTMAARREMPVHPQLIRAGFLEFVSEKRSAGAQLLFDDVPLGADGTRGDVWSKRYAHFAKQIGVNGKRLAFYSLRHTFRDAIGNTGAPEDIVDELQGWSRSKKTGRIYGSGISADRSGPWLEKLEYPGLELSHVSPDYQPLPQQKH